MPDYLFSRNQKMGLKEFLPELTNTKIGWFSFFVSISYGVRLFRKNHLYEEFNGHFNSPQNKLNRILTINMVQDVFIKSALLFAFTFGSLSLWKNYLLGEDKLIEKFIEEERKEKMKSLSYKRQKLKSIVVESEEEGEIRIEDQNSIKKEKAFEQKVKKYLGEKDSD